MIHGPHRRAESAYKRESCGQSLLGWIAVAGLLIAGLAVASLSFTAVVAIGAITTAAVLAHRLGRGPLRSLTARWTESPSQRERPALEAADDVTIHIHSDRARAVLDRVDDGDLSPKQAAKELDTSIARVLRSIDERPELSGRSRRPARETAPAPSSPSR